MKNNIASKLDINLYSDDDKITSSSSRLVFSDVVIQKIASVTVCEIKGVLAMKGNLIDNFSDSLLKGNNFSKGISVEVGKTQTAIHLQVILEHGYSIPEIFQNTSNLIKERIKHMTGLDLVKFHMHVSEICTNKEWSEINNFK